MRRRKAHPAGTDEQSWSELRQDGGTMTVSEQAPAFETYRPSAGCHDALVDPGGAIRLPWRSVGPAFAQLGTAELQRRAGEANRLLEADGVFHHASSSGEHTDGEAAARWRLDALPAVLDSGEWAALERGVIQRAELLDLVAADLYGPRQLVARGLIPPALVFGNPAFARACDGLALPGGRQLLTYAADLARNADDGSWRVLADHTGFPSGAGFALKHRMVQSRVFPSLYREAQVHRLAPFFRSFRAALQAMAPEADRDPRIVLLTSGPTSEDAFEQALLATSLGYSLVEGGDLFVRDGRLWLRSISGPEPVDVVVRQIDASRCDPLELPWQARTGIPGLVETARRGKVTVVNGLGTAVLESPALNTCLPQVARALLGQPLELADIETWWCGRPAECSHVLANLHRLVVKPAWRGGGAAHLGWLLTDAELDRLRQRIEHDPSAWVGQRWLQAATTPTLSPYGVEPAGALLRAFAVSQGLSYMVMPGGFTRVQQPPRRLAELNGSPNAIGNGGGRDATAGRSTVVKDTWVLASEPEATSALWLQDGGGRGVSVTSGAPSARSAENLLWVGRYAERADATVRLLRVVQDRRNELADGSGPAGEECVALLATALGHVTGTNLPIPAARSGPGASALPPELGPALVSLAVDRHVPGTVAFALDRLLYAADAVRDQLSMDTFLVIGGVQHYLSDQLGGLVGTDRQAEVQRGLSDVLNALLAFAGLASESLVRDAVWQFMDAGRRIERGLHLAGLLRATVVTDHGLATDSLLYESVLTAAESIITYRRRYRSRARLDTLLELLLMDPINPRSLLFTVLRLEEAVNNLPAGPFADSRAQQLPGRLCLELSALLRLADPAHLATEGRAGELGPLLGRVEELLLAVASALEAAHFTRLPPLRIMGGA